MQSESGFEGVTRHGQLQKCGKHSGYKLNLGKIIGKKIPGIRQKRGSKNRQGRQQKIRPNLQAGESRIVLEQSGRVQWVSGA